MTSCERGANGCSRRTSAWLVGAGPRRVPGLRREEVAILAGVSTDYYLRARAGARRRTRPTQVLDALARALRLDDGRHRLPARARATGGARRRSRRGTTSSEDATRWLIDSWPLTAAVVHSRHVDVLASNALARRLNPNFRVGVNSVALAVHGPGRADVPRRLGRCWRARSVALLRSCCGRPDRDARLDALVADGSAAQRAVPGAVGPTGRACAHRRRCARPAAPAGGRRSRCASRGCPLVGTDGQSLFLYFAEPGSPSAAAMQRLAGAGWDQQGQEPDVPEV